MDAKYLRVTLSNDLEWSKHIANMTNKVNSKLTFLRHNLEYGATIWEPFRKYNSDKVERVQRRAARFIKSNYTRYSSVSDMPDKFGMVGKSLQLHVSQYKQKTSITPLTQTYFNTPRLKALSLTMATTQQTFPHNLYNIHKNKHVPYTYIYCL